MHRGSSSFLALVAALWAAGCGGTPRFEPTAPPGEQLEELREWHQEEPGDVDGRAEYARALVVAEEYEEALLLTGPEAPADHQADARVRVLRGIALEETGAYPSADSVYQALLEDPAAAPFLEEVQARAQVVRDRLLQEEARAAVAREAELADVVPSGGTLAVLPFRVSSSSPGMDPLGRAFAELLVTDLALAGRFEILERVQVQALVDEMNLGDAGLAEPRTAARSGRLLGAGNLVQGTLTLTGGRLRSDAAVVTVAGTADPEVEPFTREEAADALMALEAQLALDILAELGVSLTPAEEARILDRPQVRLEALLAFGEGLRAYDLGNLVQAEALFQQTVELEPDFSLAQSRQAATARRLLADAPELARLAELAVLQDRLLRDLALNALGSRSRILRLLGADGRTPLVDALGQDRVAPASLYLELYFRRPGG